LPIRNTSFDKKKSYYTHNYFANTPVVKQIILYLWCQENSGTTFTELDFILSTTTIIFSVEPNLMVSDHVFSGKGSYVLSQVPSLLHEANGIGVAIRLNCFLRNATFCNQLVIDKEHSYISCGCLWSILHWMLE
jgi:hypothetical protein